MWCLRVCVCADSPRAPDPPRRTHRPPACVGHPALDALRRTALRRPNVFSLSCHKLSFFSSLPWGSSRGIVVVIQGRAWTTKKCAFGLPAPFCKTLAACKPLGLATPSGLSLLRGHTMTHPRMAKVDWPNQDGQKRIGPKWSLP